MFLSLRYFVLVFGFGFLSDVSFPFLLLVISVFLPSNTRGVPRVKRDCGVLRPSHLPLTIIKFTDSRNSSLILYTFYLCSSEVSRLHPLRPGPSRHVPPWGHCGYLPVQTRGQGVSRTSLSFPSRRRRLFQHRSLLKVPLT